MSQLSFDKFGENLPVSGVVAFSQVAIGLGVGLLVADRIGENARRNAAFALLGIGVASIVPVIVGVPGTVAGVTATDAADASPVPKFVTAFTVKV